MEGHAQSVEDNLIDSLVKTWGELCYQPTQRYLLATGRQLILTYWGKGDKDSNE